MDRRQENHSAKHSTEMNRSRSAKLKNTYHNPAYYDDMDYYADNRDEEDFFESRYGDYDNYRDEDIE